jgi:hypothetical protein
VVGRLLFFGAICYTQSRSVRLVPRLHPNLLESGRVMVKRLIGALLLLLVVAVQALAADCDLRCATMTATSGHHGCGDQVQTEPTSTHATHCDGMTMQSDKQNDSVSACGLCRPSFCKLQSEAIATRFASDEFNSQTSTIFLPLQSVLLLAAGRSSLSTIYRSPLRLEMRAPLDLRPGSSLRI